MERVTFGLRRRTREVKGGDRPIATQVRQRKEWAEKVGGRTAGCRSDAGRWWTGCGAHLPHPKHACMGEKLRTRYIVGSQSVSHCHSWQVSRNKDTKAKCLSLRVRFTLGVVPPPTRRRCCLCSLNFCNAMTTNHFDRRPHPARPRRPGPIVMFLGAAALCPPARPPGPAPGAQRPR